jgi:hypothetical protein
MLSEKVKDKADTGLGKEHVKFIHSASIHSSISILYMVPTLK